jgi:hypothetical protein
MEATASVGVDGHGIAVDLPLEEEETGMRGRVAVGGKRREGREREVRRDTGGLGHGGEFRAEEIRTLLIRKGDLTIKQRRKDSGKTEF